MDREYRFVYAFFLSVITRLTWFSFPIPISTEWPLNSNTLFFFVLPAWRTSREVLTIKRLISSSMQLCADLYSEILSLTLYRFSSRTFFLFFSCKINLVSVMQAQLRSGSAIFPKVTEALWPSHKKSFLDPSLLLLLIFAPISRITTGKCSRTNWERLTRMECRWNRSKGMEKVNSYQQLFWILLGIPRLQVNLKVICQVIQLLLSWLPWMNLSLIQSEQTLQRRLLRVQLIRDLELESQLIDWWTRLANCCKASVKKAWRWVAVSEEMIPGKEHRWRVQGGERERDSKTLCLKRLQDSKNQRAISSDGS